MLSRAIHDLTQSLQLAFSYVELSDEAKAKAALREALVRLEALRKAAELC